MRLEDCCFHESVDLSEFESSRTLLVKPPEGEVGLMTVNNTQANGRKLCRSIFAEDYSDVHR